MQNDWETAIAFVLKMEGGYTLDPHDPGGETNFGISKKAYPNVDIKNITVEAAKEIYRRDYWQACRCDELPSDLAIATFDCAVNQGVGKARRILQIALDVDVDGIIGEKTITAAFKASRYRVKKLLAERTVEYIRLIAHNQNLMVFAHNWSYRVLSLADLVFNLKTREAH